MKGIILASITCLFISLTVINCHPPVKKSVSEKSVSEKAISSNETSGGIVLSKGQKYVIENKFTANSTQQVAGQSMESKADFTTVNNIEVKDIKDNNYNLVNTFTKITANMNAMGQDMKFDSDKKEDMDGDMGKNMKDIINQPKDVIVDRQGKIVADKNDTSKKNSENGMMSMMMQQFFGSAEESGFGVSQAFMIIPPDAKPGFTWVDSSSNNGIKNVTNYTIKEINGTDATVTIDGIINTDAKMEMQGMEIGSKTTGKLTGEQVVDVKTGIIKQRTTNLESSGNMQAMGQDIPMTTKLSSVSTIKLM